MSVCNTVVSDRKIIPQTAPITDTCLKLHMASDLANIVIEFLLAPLYEDDTSYMSMLDQEGITAAKISWRQKIMNQHNVRYVSNDLKDRKKVNAEMENIYYFRIMNNGFDEQIHQIAYFRSDNIAELCRYGHLELAKHYFTIFNGHNKPSDNIFAKYCSYILSKYKHDECVPWLLVAGKNRKNT